MPIDSANSCRYCYSNQQRIFSATERMLGLGGEFTYAACTSCGSVQQVTIPEDLSLFYPSDYYSLGRLQLSGSVLNFLKKIRMWSFLTTGHSFFSPRFGGYLLKKLNPKLTDRIADVGCGNGQLLYELHVLGFQDLHGFDPFLEKQVQLASGLTLWKQEFGQTDLNFDLVMLHHSFEHLEDPEAALALMYNQEGKGDQACFFCVKPGIKSGAASWA